MTTAHIPPALEQPWPTVYVGVGNSDDKLTQRKWADFLRELRDLIRAYPTKIHGWWYSGPEEEWQNACVAFELNPLHRADFRKELTQLRATYRQDSVAWAEVAVTDFV